jgi:hypothetical protein
VVLGLEVAGLGRAVGDDVAQHVPGRELGVDAGRAAEHVRELGRADGEPGVDAARLAVHVVVLGLEVAGLGRAAAVPAVSVGLRVLRLDRADGGLGGGAARRARLAPLVDGRGGVSVSPVVGLAGGRAVDFAFAVDAVDLCLLVVELEGADRARSAMLSGKGHAIDLVAVVGKPVGVGAAPPAKTSGMMSGATSGTSHASSSGSAPPALLFSAKGTSSWSAPSWSPCSGASTRLRWRPRPRGGGNATEVLSGAAGRFGALSRSRRWGRSVEDRRSSSAAGALGRRGRSSGSAGGQPAEGE